MLAKTTSTRVNATKSGTKVVVSNGSIANPRGEPAILAISEEAGCSLDDSSVKILSQVSFQIIQSGPISREFITNVRKKNSSLLETKSLHGPKSFG